MRRDFGGEVLTASYDHWSPFSKVDPATGGPGGGILPDIFATLARQLNFTARYLLVVPFPLISYKRAVDRMISRHYLGALMDVQIGKRRRHAAH